MQDSLEELSVLVKKWPKEPSIYVSRGKVRWKDRGVGGGEGAIWGGSEGRWGGGRQKGEGGSYGERGMRDIGEGGRGGREGGV